jgi:hypothetical protein
MGRKLDVAWQRWRGRRATMPDTNLPRIWNSSFDDDDALDKKIDELEKALFKLLPEKEDLLRQDATMSSSRHKFSNVLSTATLDGTKALTFENL